MEKDFVPYALAVKLKALGFDEECFSYYDLNNKPNFFGFDGLMDTHCVQVNRPTFSQAFRWFREKYKLHTEIRPYTAKYFTIIIQECKDIVKYIEYGGIYLKFKTYEEAELACLEKLIEIVESKSE